MLNNINELLNNQFECSKLNNNELTGLTNDISNKIIYINDILTNEEEMNGESLEKYAEVLDLLFLQKDDLVRLSSSPVFLVTKFVDNNFKYELTKEISDFMNTFLTSLDFLDKAYEIELIKFLNKYPTNIPKYLKKP